MQTIYTDNEIESSYIPAHFHELQIQECELN